LHSNGFSLVRSILSDQHISYTDHSAELGGNVGEILLEPTRLYTAPLLKILENPSFAGAVHSISHVTGGGIAANLARVLPRGSWAEVERSTWSPPGVFRALMGMRGDSLESVESTWNLGIGMFVVVAPSAAEAVTAALAADGIRTWEAGRVSMSLREFTGFEQGAKGVDGGAVRLTGSYRA
jgi:phosphoribosylformylglycinamidine cyclo-ligase